MTFVPPILDHPTGEDSVFRPESLLARAASLRSSEGRQSEGRQSEGRPGGAGDEGQDAPEPLPRGCILDFDAELVAVARRCFGAAPCAGWACFHTTLWRLEPAGGALGLIAGTVGAPYAVLVAEQLIASGCRHVVAYGSAGAVAAGLPRPFLVVPERALRDEGTSYHYLPPAAWARARGALPGILARHAAACGLPLHRGLTWTTDAPYRETRSQLDRHRAAGVLAVEMEAAALMALAEARGAEIASLLHVTNALATAADDFQKGGPDVGERVLSACVAALTEALGAPLIPGPSPSGRRAQDGD